MIDLHMHSIFSDGELIPAELIRRAEHFGYTAMAITDHADISNLDWIIPRMIQVCKWCNSFNKIKALPGIELTHVPPKAISDMASKARDLGAVVIVVHGETLSEPVAPGTNLAALESDIDILAHPGLLSETEAKMAADRGIYLEISARKGHSLSNGRVAKIAKKFSAKLVLNTDTHSPGDLITYENACKIAYGAGLEKNEAEALFVNSKRIVESALERLMKG
ncbi:MAG: histidinol phosphate phosphatase domain-containing protein [bacterium]